MAVTIPTIDELTDSILNDYATEFNTDVANLGVTYQVKAKVTAGVLYQMYLALSDVQRNVYYDLAEEDQLIRYGLQILGRTPAPAEAGIYTLEVTGEIGAVIPAQTQFQANDTTTAAGYLFIVDTEKTLTAETDTVQVRALTAGVISKLFVGDLVTATAPIADVNSEALVSIIDTEPVAAESIESYRDDILEAERLEAQGGASSDYRLWSSDVPEVRTVYSYVKDGSPGDINIYIEATVENSEPLATPGVPTQQTIDDVYKAPVEATPESGAVIFNDAENRGRKPLTVFTIFPFPVTPIPVDLFFTALTDESIKDEIRTVIGAYLYEVRPFVSGATSISDKNDLLTLAQIIGLTINLLAGTGITYTDLTMNVDGNQESSYLFEDGFYPYLRTINNNGSPI